jgi:hypothetical protein
VPALSHLLPKLGVVSPDITRPARGRLPGWVQNFIIPKSVASYTQVARRLQSISGAGRRVARWLPSRWKAQNCLRSLDLCQETGHRLRQVEKANLLRRRGAKPRGSRSQPVAEIAHSGSHVRGAAQSWDRERWASCGIQRTKVLNGASGLSSCCWSASPYLGWPSPSGSRHRPTPPRSIHRRQPCFHQGARQRLRARQRPRARQPLTARQRLTCRRPERTFPRPPPRP